MDYFPVGVEYRLRLKVRTIVPVVINGTIFSRNLQGAIIEYPINYSSANALTNAIDASLNTQLFRPFAVGSSHVSTVLQMQTVGVRSGQCYVTADLIPDLNSAIPIRTLIGGYLSTSTPLSSDTPIVSSLSGEGAEGSQNAKAVLVGGNASSALAVPNNLVYELVSARFQNQLLNPAISPSLSFGVQDSLGNNIIYDWIYTGFTDACIAIVTLAQFLNYRLDTQANSVIINMGIPKLRLYAGSVVSMLQSQVQVLNFDTFAFRQWINP